MHRKVQTTDVQYNAKQYRRKESFFFGKQNNVQWYKLDEKKGEWINMLFLTDKEKEVTETELEEEFRFITN